jgi:hypothetical protein
MEATVGTVAFLVLVSPSLLAAPRLAMPSAPFTAVNTTSHQLMQRFKANRSRQKYQCC